MHLSTALVSRVNGAYNVSTSFKPIMASSSSRPTDEAWRSKAKPISPTSSSNGRRNYPAKEFCSSCGLCDTYYIAHVKSSCAFLGDGMSRITEIEQKAHGRSRHLDNEDELLFGVHEDIKYLRARPPVPGAQWSGVVTQIACEMLEQGKVDAVVCVQHSETDRFSPVPVVARTKQDIIKAKGVKPTLSPNLNVLATIDALENDVKRLLFIGVGCQVQALRSVEHYLKLDKLYIMGTNCVDNGPREGLDKFLRAASSDPDTVLHYEFFQDYRVHIKHLDGRIERIPYFCLPANDLNDVIAPSCYSCFDYTNAGADLVVGYMGVPYAGNGTSMTDHLQYCTIRNSKGREMLKTLQSKNGLEMTGPVSKNGLLFDRKSLVIQTVIADDEAKMGRGPARGAPRWLGEILASLLTWLGPQGLEFAKYSIEYHYIRNYLHTLRYFGGVERVEQHVPEFAKRIVKKYDENQGIVSQRAALPAPPPTWASVASTNKGFVQRR